MLLATIYLQLHSCHPHKSRVFGLFYFSFYRKIDGDFSNGAKIISQIFEYGTTDVTFSATYDDVKAVGDNTVQLCGEEFGPTFTMSPDEILNFRICYTFDLHWCRNIRVDHNGRRNRNNIKE